MDEDAAVEDVGDGGRAHQGRVGDVDGLKFAADAPVGARRELRIYVYYWRTAEMRETRECGGSVSSSDFYFFAFSTFYTRMKEDRDSFGANYLPACSIHEASASWPWQKAASRKVAALTSNVNACLFSYTLLAYARFV